ncbi:hypothetical protein AAG906_018950 [Vitis piasezkii]
MSVVYPGDKCWFGVESKSFEDLIEETKRKGLRPAVLSKMGSFLESLGWSGDPKATSSKGLVLRGLLLKWWNPSMGCLMEARDVREVWVRVLGLLLHLWGKGLFKRLGEACESLVAIDEDMAECRNSQWARILVMVGSSCFMIRLWWEIPPWKSEVVGKEGRVRSRTCLKCGRRLPSTETMMKPLANKAILDETQSSWGEGPSYSSTPFLGIERGEENFSPNQESGVESGGNDASDPLSNKDFTKLVDFNRFLGMPVQGELNDEEKRKLIKSVVRTQKVDLACLLETKVQEMKLQVVRSLGVGSWSVVGSPFHVTLEIFNEGKKRISGMNWELSKFEGPSSFWRFIHMVWWFNSQAASSQKCKIPFRFENMWLLTEGFKELVRNWWTGTLRRENVLFLLRRQRLKRRPLRIIRSGFYWKKLHGDKNLGNLVKRWRQEHQVFAQDGQCSCKKEFVNQGENKWGYSIDDEEIKARVCNAYHTLLLETEDWRPSIRVYALKCWGKIDPKV